MEKLIFIHLLLFLIIFIKGLRSKNLTSSRYVIKLENHEDEYFGDVYIGSSNQKSSFIFSTASDITWVPGINCTNCRNNSNKYNYLNSDYFKNLTENYYDSNIKGNFISDSISLVADPNYEIKSNITLKFILVNDESEKINIQKADGIIGIGLEKQNNLNLISELYKQGVISSTKFAFYFSSSKYLDSKLYLGDFSFGTPISPLFKELTYCNVGNNFNQWGCELSSISVNKNNIQIQSNFMIDTGSSFIKIPISDFKVIKRHVFDATGSECIYGEKNQLHCKCDNPSIYPNIKVYVEKNLFEINTKDLIDYLPDSQFKCRFSILIDMENLYTWVIGTSALKNTFLSFDLNSRKLGFVQNPNNIEAYVSQPYIIEREISVENKIGYIFAFAFLLLLMFGLYRCANDEKFINGKIDRSESISPNDEDDKKKMQLIKNKFNTEEYDYDINLEIKNNTKYFEMKEIESQKIIKS